MSVQSSDMSPVAACAISRNLLFYELQGIWVVSLLNRLPAIYFDSLPQRNRLDEDQAIPATNRQQAVHRIFLLDSPACPVSERQQLPLFQQHQSALHQSAPI